MVARAPDLTVPLASGLIALGIVLRLGFLGADSFWLDEAFSVALASQHSVRDILTGMADELHPPLFYVILRMTFSVVGISETTARLPSALASTCGIGLIFALARRLGLNTLAATLAAVLLALAPIDIWYAQESRMYALVTAAGLAFAIGLTLDSWLGAGLAATALAAGLYLDYTMVPLSLALTGAWLVLWWHTGRSASHLARVALASSLAWFFFRPFWARLPPILDQLSGVTFFSRFERATGFRFSRSVAVAALSLAVPGVAIACAVFWRAFQVERFRQWAVWTIWGAFVVSTAVLTFPRFYSAKQILVCGWPFVVLLTAWILGGRADAVPRSDAARIAARVRLVSAVAVSLIAAVVAVSTSRADWRGVVAHLNRREPSTAIVVLDPHWNAIPYNYYQPRLPAAAAARGLSEFDERHQSSATQVCLVAERYGPPPPASPAEAWLDRHLRLVEATRFARLELRCYRR